MNKRLMIIDESSIGRLSIIRQLPEDAFQIDHVSSLEDATPYLISVRYSLIFLNLDVEDMSTLNALMETVAEARVVVTAQELNLQEWNQCLALGAVGLLPKPVLKDALFHLLKHQVAWTPPRSFSEASPKLKKA
ncbi:MAG: response regulator [Deltaproteobacteria bacterium]|nr:response regulator [Deltaproteobacteria bacterium]